MFYGWENRSESNFNPIGKASDRSNFGPNGGHECSGNSVTSPNGGAIGRAGNDWN